ncbi:MAG: hypothetical protein K8L91_23545 [Anaerolineae bacterium]|nr:hypothetical protein [Anaerolineae bacterium]
MTRFIVLILFLPVIFTPVYATNAPTTPELKHQNASTVYYVRPDGGSTEQCTGLMDAAYSGMGTGQPCAWNHPFQALPPTGIPRIVGGDTLLIEAGSYAMGYGAPGAEMCDEIGSYDCVMPPIPSGSSPDQPTRILGVGWDGECPAPPELWGTGRPWFIVNMTDASNIELACLDITDHSGCIENHSGELACERDVAPYGDWASYGLYAEDSANAHLWNLNIHGLAAGGVHAGRLTDWTVENVRVAGNGSVGWDGDLWDENGDSNSGTLLFRHWVVEWNGCGEPYPVDQPIGCWGQEAGGYGDGVGEAETGGDWIIEDSAFLHNTSDGLDLLYHTLGGTITLNRVWAEGNAGNQIKATGQTTITNSLLVGNCAFFEDQPFTYWVDHCRALGATLQIVYTGGEQMSIVNSTIYGQGDGLIGAGPREGFECNGNERIQLRNSVVMGDTDYFDSSDITFYFYQEGCGALKLDSDYNIAYRVKNLDCGATNDFTASGSHDICDDPQVTGPLAGMAYDMTLLPSSPAMDSADGTLCPTDDLLGNPRSVETCDRGAYEQ